MTWQPLQYIKETEPLLRNDITVENTTSSESLIRDTDMAKEMEKLSLHNIIAQAGESVMAQANQMNEAVLSLLQ